MEQLSKAGKRVESFTVNTVLNQHRLKGHSERKKQLLQKQLQERLTTACKCILKQRDITKLTDEKPWNEVHIQLYNKFVLASETLLMFEANALVASSKEYV